MYNVAAFIIRCKPSASINQRYHKTACSFPTQNTSLFIINVYIETLITFIITILTNQYIYLYIVKMKSVDFFLYNKCSSWYYTYNNRITFKITFKNLLQNFKSTTFDTMMKYVCCIYNIIRYFNVINWDVRQYQITCIWHMLSKTLAYMWMCKSKCNYVYIYNK